MAWQHGKGGGENDAEAEVTVAGNGHPNQSKLSVSEWPSLGDCGSGGGGKGSSSSQKNNVTRKKKRGRMKKRRQHRRVEVVETSKKEETAEVPDTDAAVITTPAANGRNEVEKGSMMDVIAARNSGAGTKEAVTKPSSSRDGPSLASAPKDFRDDEKEAGNTTRKEKREITSPALAGADGDNSENKNANIVIVEHNKNGSVLSSASSSCGSGGEEGGERKRRIDTEGMQGDRPRKGSVAAALKRLKQATTSTKKQRGHEQPRKGSLRLRSDSWIGRGSSVLKN